jgi:hypothetical protein
MEDDQLLASESYQISNNTYCSLGYAKKKVEWKMNVEVIIYYVDDRRRMHAALRNSAIVWRTSLCQRVY